MIRQPCSKVVQGGGSLNWSTRLNAPRLVPSKTAYTHVWFHPRPGLLCLKTAKSGGESSWSSSVAVHNELLRIGRKDLVEALSGPWCAVVDSNRVSK